MASEDTLCTLRYDIQGMHCAACSSRIERVVGRMEGVSGISVNLATARAEVRVPRARRQELAAAIAAKVASLGFGATPSRADDPARQFAEHQHKADAERRSRLRRLLPMLIFAVPLLCLSMGHMLGLPLSPWLAPDTAPQTFMLVQLALTLPVVWLGRHFYAEGLLALARRSPTMDSLVATGTGAAFLFSLVNTVLGLLGDDPAGRAMNLYYESCAVLVTMIEFGQFLEFSARRKAGDAMGALLRLTPEYALRVHEDGGATEIPLAEVEEGDVLLVRPGARIPVDGVILTGSSAVDLSLLTGESVPVAVAVGDELVAGSVNGEGPLTMRAVHVGQDTRLARIIRLVREAQGSKAPIARLADRVSFYFVPAVMALAVLAALAWWLLADEPVSTPLTVFVAVLVMACPCAMGLATPMSIMVGTGRGAQLGVLIKNGAALEQTGRLDVIVVDKTGTLTTGKPMLAGMQRLADAPEALSDADMLAVAAALESQSEHPLARAIVTAAAERGLPACPVRNVSIWPGRGIAGIVRLGQTEWRVAMGSTNLMGRLGSVVPDEILEQLAVSSARGETPLMLAIAPHASETPADAPGDGLRLSALLGLADALRPESPAVVRRLRHMGLRVIMLTGDNERTARAIAVRAGIDPDEVGAGLLPDEKAGYIRRLQERGHVVGMVGDGINDAPALALADVGMAVGGGVDVSAEAGDIVLMRGGMTAVLTALALSRATLRNIRQNLGWAFGYNLLGLPVAAGLLHAFGGPMLSPILAGTAMALSSFSVVSNALRLRFFHIDAGIDTGDAPAHGE
ncbi:MAG TPA: heavy metal translocating P-type ATPase [Candidatus Desulfovibrio intestinavium]|uniref:P-type Cu(+) transporter n=1 Tax=Candidatus Desulfovibrio intestinavium TaxID=2838534 RepID=A0A9D2HNA7_9BACT|nr:heavy metal translocating P-type ATPase [Candidatus Desulfovibrio intestinavium]